MNFNKLALEKLNDIAPSLGRYIVAFRDMKDEVPSGDDVEAGCFILKMGGSRYIIPVVAKGSTLLPLDSVFFEADGQFRPLNNKTIEQIRNNTSDSLGSAKRTPRTAVKNPDVYSLVVPPRTGKFMYASDGNLESVIVRADPTVRAVLADNLEKLAQEDLLGDYDVAAMTEALRDLPQLRFEKSAEIEVILDGEGLSDAEVQDILSKGYHVRGQHRTRRVAMETGGHNTYREISGVEEGQAYMAVKASGGEVPLAVLPYASGLSAGSGKADPQRTFMALTPDAFYPRVEGNIIVSNIAVDYGEILKGWETEPAANMAEMKYALVFDSTGYFLFRRDDIAMVDGSMTTLKGNVYQPNGSRVFTTLRIPAAMHGLVVKDWENNNLNILLSPEARVVDVTDMMDGGELEFSMRRALQRQEMRETTLLGDKHTLVHHQGEFAVDGKPFGHLPEVMKYLVTKVMMEPTDAEAFIKTASEKGRVDIFLSKAAADSTIPTPIEETGRVVPEALPISGTAAERNLGLGRLRAAAKTRDREVLDTTLMAELLTTPDMRETIREYLPNIKETIDRLGRTLFLIRLSSGKLKDQVDSNTVTTMAANVKTAYNNLGETLLKLEQMTSNV